jgi:hypothetical protein
MRGKTDLHSSNELDSHFVDNRLNSGLSTVIVTQAYYSSFPQSFYTMP